MIFGMISNEENLLKEPIRKLEFIKKLIPHREPMVMVDALIYYSTLKAISELTISGTNIFVKDGYFSETGLIEHMAQTAALHTGYKFFLEKLPVNEGFIGSVKSLNIVKLPNVNDTITTELQIMYEVANMTIVKLITILGGKIIAEAEMNTVLKERGIHE